MLVIVGWIVIYSIVVATSIIFIGKPSAVLGTLTIKSLLSLLLDWRFLLGGILALGARFIFVIINNLTSKIAQLSHAHLSLTALAATASIVVVLIANHFFLHEQLRPIQLAGAGVMLFGIFLVFH